EKMKELEELQEEYKEISEKAESALKIYSDKNKAFLDEQAGIIAEKLEEGTPCPVCGSLTHPAPAQKSENAPSETELKEAKSAADKAGQQAQNKSLECSSVRSSLETQKQTIEKQIESDGLQIPFEEADSRIEEELKKLKEAINTLETEIEKANEKKERRVYLEESLPKEEKELEEIKALIEKEKNEATKAEATKKSKTEQYSEEKSKLSFDSRAKAMEKYNELQAAADKMKKALKQAEENYSNSDKRKGELEASITELKKQLSNVTGLDKEKEEQNKDALTQEKESANNQAKQVHTRIVSNESTLQNIKSKSNALDDWEKRYQMILPLSNTANGSILGKERLKLETYIQTTYFDRIIARANTRFKVMSGNQYELKRCREAEDKRIQSGLDLNIIDHYNNTERSVKSLSGGESFMAALSLALGLSDEIQSSAGGIKLDTMFVDEGFGSLDDESMSKAIKALSELTEGNRLVGIISHVSELKNKIDKQIKITKGNDDGGSKAEIIV
ncbi:MAG: SMC family ATPase, partial [Ruminiclostridium sp.]|nr:SMC family ATPase [Ruminiclostridium sp.]